MSKTFEQGREEVAKLCKYFADNRRDFFAAGVKEAHVRQSLIDPFFEALGWDMRNAAMTALQYREVIPEDSLEIEGQQKAPDYTFRVGTLAKFYTEAKKCGVNINADPGPAYQLRRYGWSAKVPLSILTDFEELGVYDCSLRPRSTDKASFGRIQYYRSEEYPDRWRELWDIFSREAVWAGAYDRYAASKRKRGTSEVDSEFLKEIEGWRDALARNIALRNLYLGYDDLNTAVQRTIDRLIFLRMAEDRGSEAYGQLLKLCEQPEIYNQFMKLCRKADEKYNSGIFHFQKEDGISEQPDRFTPALTIDDKVIKPILQSLYFENGSPYHFGVLPVEILGTVYERFLGKVIRLTADHRAKVEEKPEVRKAGGVYYTPAYIVNYIVTNTVGKMIENKSPAQLAIGKNGQPLRVLDMACGSGSFLLGAYQYLLDHCLKWYLDNHPEKHKDAVYFDGRRKFWRLTITEKKRILISHIFGVDIDLQAVEVSKLSLLLKVLEGETDETVGQSRQLFHERALPNLSNNIKCGNSLIGPDYFSGRLIPDPDEMNRVNPFDWTREFPDAMGSGGFDCVIGNPPYVLGRETFDENIKKYLAYSFKGSKGKFDLYLYFTEKAINLIRELGKFGFIIPNTFLVNENAIYLREIIVCKTQIEIIKTFSDRVFSKAQVESVIIVLERNKNTPRNEISIENKNCYKISQSIFTETKDFRFNLLKDDISINLLKRIEEKSSRLGDISDICIGIQLGGSSKEAKKESFLANIKKNNVHKKVLDGKNINRYQKQWSGIYVRYGDWLHRKRDEKYFLTPKIIIRQIGATPIATFDDECFYTLNTIYNLISTTNFNPKYFLAIINSSLGKWFWLKENSDFKTIFPKIKKTQIEAIPIRNLQLEKTAEKSCHDKIVEIVSAMLDLNNKLHLSKTEQDKTVIKRQIDATDREIDRLVYELYGLTEEEIKIVEDGVAK